MTTIKRIALPIAKFLKRFEAPHLLKFVFFQFIKNRNIRTVSMLEISNASVNLDLGNFIEYWIYMDGLYEKK